MICRRLPEKIKRNVMNYCNNKISGSCLGYIEEQFYPSTGINHLFLQRRRRHAELLLEGMREV